MFQVFVGSTYPCTPCTHWTEHDGDYVSACWQQRPNVFIRLLFHISDNGVVFFFFFPFELCSSSLVALQLRKPSLLKSQQACIVLDKLVLLSESRILSNAALWAEVKPSLAAWPRKLT